MNPKFYILFYFILTLSVFSQDFGGGHEEGKRLLEEKHYVEAEKLALSLLSNNPSDATAEFILASANIGMGRDAAKKGNYALAVELLQKASIKFPFDSSLKDEIGLLRKKQTQRNVIHTGIPSSSRTSPNSVYILDPELFRTIEELKFDIKSTSEFVKDFNQKNSESNASVSNVKILIGVGILLSILLTFNLVLTWNLYRRPR